MIVAKLGPQKQSATVNSLFAVHQTPHCRINSVDTRNGHRVCTCLVSMALTFFMLLPTQKCSQQSCRELHQLSIDVYFINIYPCSGDKSLCNVNFKVSIQKARNLLALSCKILQKLIILLINPKSQMVPMCVKRMTERERV